MGSSGIIRLDPNRVFLLKPNTSQKLVLGWVGHYGLPWPKVLFVISLFPLTQDKILNTWNYGMEVWPHFQSPFCSLLQCLLTLFISSLHRVGSHRFPKQQCPLCNVRGAKTMTVTMVESLRNLLLSSEGLGIPTVNWLQGEECQAGNWDPHWGGQDQNPGGLRWKSTTVRTYSEIFKSSSLSYFVARESWTFSWCDTDVLTFPSNQGVKELYLSKMLRGWSSSIIWPVLVVGLSPSHTIIVDHIHTFYVRGQHIMAHESNPALRLSL